MIHQNLLKIDILIFPFPFFLKDPNDNFDNFFLKNKF